LPGGPSGRFVTRLAPDPRARDDIEAQTAAIEYLLMCSSRPWAPICSTSSRRGLPGRHRRVGSVQRGLALLRRTNPSGTTTAVSKFAATRESDTSSRSYRRLTPRRQAVFSTDESGTRRREACRCPAAVVGGAALSPSTVHDRFAECRRWALPTGNVCRVVTTRFAIRCARPTARGRPAEAHPGDITESARSVSPRH
jgi:hypothetical protein